jgi:hypothetical protein
MSVKRHYGDNGELIRYEMKKRGKRYYFKTQLKDIAIRFTIVCVGFGLLTVWYLINN